MTEAYPLQWPQGWPRTQEYNRKRAKFARKVTKQFQNGASYQQSERLTIADSMQRIINELSSLGVQGGRWVISSNLELRTDGLPRSGQREPTDPGVAVYWSIGDKKNVMAIDIYDRIADNMAAVAATLNALRAIDRHGGAQILERAFAGFTALPPPEGHQSEKPLDWREEFGPIYNNVPVDEMLIIVEGRYRSAAKLIHPDVANDPLAEQKMARLNQAIKQAREALR